MKRLRRGNWQKGRLCDSEGMRAELAEEGKKKKKTQLSKIEGEANERGERVMRSSH